jgi:hypothetical protein
VSKLVGQVISWPVAVVVLVLVLRKSIVELIPKLRSWEGPAGRFSFGPGVEVAEKAVDRAAKSAGATHGGVPLSDVRREPDDLAREVATNPAYGVLIGWERLSGALHNLADAAGMAPDNDTDRLGELLRSGVAIWPPWTVSPN